MTTAQWREKAGGFLSSSSFRLRSATLDARDAAKVAGASVVDAADRFADAAERAGSAVLSRWTLLRQKQKQQQVREQEERRQQNGGDANVQARLKSAAASTGTILKKGFNETKGKVEEAARKAAIRSRSIIASIEWWQKGSSGRGVFGVPLEVIVQRQKGPKPIPQIVTRCVDFLILSGLHSENLFKEGGSPFVVDRLVDLYNEDWNSPLVDGVSPIDVASLLKVYLRALPEPILTFHLYDDVVKVGEDVRGWRDVVAKLPYVNYSTLECLTSLLLRVSELSSINKMDARSLAFVLAPVLLWKKEERSNGSSRGPSKPLTSALRSSQGGTSGEGLAPKKSPSVSVTFVNVKDSSHDWEGDGNGHVEGDKVDLSAQIPLDDEPTSVDFELVEAVQCLIEQHNAIFAHGADGGWQDNGGL